MAMNKVQTILGSILRSALEGKQLKAPVELNRRQWKELFKRTIQQQVAALVYEELAGSTMPDDVRADWQAYTQFSARRFDTQLMALTRLAALLEAENVRMMVLKGFGLALTYPQPQLRECGDIDIFCYDDYDKVNDFIISSGLDPEARETEEKHFGFEVNGIEVENHRKFCTDSNRANRHVGKVLMKMSSDEPLRDPRLPGILFPTPQMGALHLIAHTLMHLWWSGITLRHLCDVTQYLRSYADRIDFAQLHEVLAEAGLDHSASLLLSLCHQLLGLEYDKAIWPKCCADSLETILHSIFHPFKNSCFTRDPFRKFYRKVVMHRFRARLYRIVYGEQYPESFLSSFVILQKFRIL